MARKIPSKPKTEPPISLRRARRAIATGIAFAAVFGLSVPGSATAANGSNPAARASAEYSEAIHRADKDYAAANRRCEVLGMRERKLCVQDSARARGAAITEAQAKRAAPAKKR